MTMRHELPLHAMPADAGLTTTNDTKESMDQTLITRIVEAALLAANQPLTLAQLHALFPLDEPAPTDSVETALETLKADCANRGVELVELASGFRYQVQEDVHAWVARLWTERQTKYTRATLETLALIAYRQPITRGEIEQVRGVAVNSNIIKALEEREWIRVIGHRDVPGRPELLGTTKHFLDYFGLKRLDELPPLSELKDFGELEPQFQFDGNTPGDGAMPIGDVASDSTDDDLPSDPDGEDFPANDTDDDIDADTPHHDESQDESNDPALAEDGDSIRSNTNE
jgi:segregation and condensation protein B